MAIDGNYDGKITIQKGQGISQAIRDELGLTQEECNKLGGSIWTQIFQQVESQNKQGQIYSGGSDLKGPTNKNFIVHPNQVIEFSKEIWNNIVQLVNDKLGKNIGKLESTLEVDPNPPSNDPNPPANDPNPPKTISEVVERPNATYSCDSKGNLSTYHINEYYDNNQEQVAKHISYDLNGTLLEYYTCDYDTEGIPSKTIYYNPDGTVQSYFKHKFVGDRNLSTEYNADGTIKQ